MVRSLLAFLVLCVIARCATSQVLGQQSLSQSSYVIDNKGHLFAWGWNADGQLGIGGTTNQNVPVQVMTPATVQKWVALAGGSRHALAIGDSDELFAWGLNLDGELGNGTTVGQPTPSRIPNPPGVTSWRAISAGTDHSIAIASNGMIYVWGGNAHGQLGLGDRTPHSTLQQLPLPAGVSAWSRIAAGDQLSVAIATNGTSYYWGKVTNTADSLVPFRIGKNLRTVGPLSLLAARFAPAVSGDPDAYHAVSGQGFWSRPNLLSGYHNAISVADGGNHYLMLTSAGTLYADGDNSFGQMGVGGNLNYVKFPEAVTQWTAIAAGLNHSLAMGNDGYLYAFGDNRFGQLGDGSGSNQLVPVRVGKFGDSIRLTGWVACNDTFSGVPFLIHASVTNTTESTLTSPVASIILRLPLKYSTSAASQAMSPSLIAAGASATTAWSIDADSLNGLPDSIQFCAYITAQGSAPLLISNKVWIESRADSRHLLLYLRDSLHSTPLARALVWIQSRVQYQPRIDTVLSRPDGAFFFPKSNLEGYNIAVMKENYAVREWTLDNPETDTFDVPFDIPPAAIIGTFAKTEASGLLPYKTAYPDSMIGFGLRADQIVSTSDGGKHWTDIYTSADHLEDIVFHNRKAGWAVGANGSILHTTDGGITWKSESLPGVHAALHAIASLNSDRWAVGDSGTVLHQTGTGPWLVEPPFTTEDLYTLSFFDTAHGMVAGTRGVAYHYEGHWVRLSSGHDYTLRTSSYPVPTRFWVGGDSGLMLPYIYGTPFPASVPEPLYTQHSMRGLQFINGLVGFAVGDSGSNFVTYDSGHFWAPLTEINESSSGLSFFGTVCHATGTASLFTYEGSPSPISGILRGRQFDRDNISGIAGETVILYGPTNIPYVNYTNNLGNYVFTGLPIGTYSMDFKVPLANGNILSAHYDSLKIGPSAVLTQDNYFPGAAVTEAQMPSYAPTLYPNPASGFVTVYTYGDSPVSIDIFDVLGRRVLSEQSKEGGLYTFSTQSLAAGQYVVHVKTGGSIRIARLQILR